MSRNLSGRYGTFLRPIYLNLIAISMGKILKFVFLKKFAIIKKFDSMTKLQKPNYNKTLMKQNK